MAKIFSAVPFLKHLMAYWFQFALMFEAFFILTTIDAGTRVCRCIIQELGGHIYKPFGDLKSNAANIISSMIVVLAWAFFIYTGSLTAIWPMFGTANQLLAMLALCLGTTVIIKMGKVKYAWVTFVPMVFMTVITFTSSVMLLIDFIGKASGPGPDTTIYLVDAVLMALILILAVIILVDSIVKWYSFFSRRTASPSPETNY